MTREAIVDKYAMELYLTTSHKKTKRLLLKLLDDLDNVIKHDLPPAEGAEQLTKEQFTAIIEDSVKDVWYGRRSVNPVKEQTELLVEKLYPLMNRRQPTAEGAEEILAKGRVLMYGNIIVDPIMLPEGIYATKELRIYLPETTIEHLLETGKSFRDKTQTRWLPDSYFDNLSKCELIDVDVVRDVTLHAQRIADKMVSERLREELIRFAMWTFSGGETAAITLVNNYTDNLTK